MHCLSQEDEQKDSNRHTLCINCRGFDCDINTRCEECLEWPEEEVRLYVKYRKSLKSKDSSSKSKTSVPTPPPADSRHSPQPAPRADLQAQVDSLSATVHSLSETLSSRLDTFMFQLLSHANQLSSQPRLGPDAGEPQPGETAGESSMFQALGAPSRTSLVSPLISTPLLQEVRAPASEQLGSTQAPPPRSAPGAAPQSQPLRLLRSHLRVLGCLLLNPPPLVGSRLALRLLARVVTPVHPRSRRPVRLRVMS